MRAARTGLAALLRTDVVGCCVETMAVGCKCQAVIVSVVSQMSCFMGMGFCFNLMLSSSPCNDAAVKDGSLHGSLASGYYSHWSCILCKLGRAHVQYNDDII